MDPNACFEEIIRSVKTNLKSIENTHADEIGRINDLILALLGWLRGGGFPPTSIEFPGADYMRFNILGCGVAAFEYDETPTHRFVTFKFYGIDGKLKDLFHFAPGHK